MIISEKMMAHRDDLTRSERQLVAALLDDYPIAGLGSITELAVRAEVSTTTITRLLQKIGLDGYAQFQAALRDELKEMISDPVAKRNTWRASAPEEHILNRYGRQALENQQRTLDEIDPVEFDAFCDLLCQPERRIYIAGGRISSALAQYLYLHLQMIRPDVRLLPPGGSWPHDLLDLREGDVVVLLDVRRYENTTLSIGQMCHERGARIVLFTDPWGSPIQRLAELSFGARIVVPSAWDSLAPHMVLLECVIAQVQEQMWETVKERNDALEDAFDRTKLFRKFS